MRVSREEKERSRQRIVGAASRRFRGRGIAGTSVADVMTDAELTHGGFYRHFDSKDQLLAAALDEAFGELLTSLESATADAQHRQALAQFVARYLDARHAAAPERGCPIAALATEMPRESEVARRAFSSGVARAIGALAAPTGTRASRSDRDAATLLLLQLVGAVVLARSADPELAKDLLRVARAAVSEPTSPRSR